MSARPVSASDILTPEEIAAIVAYAHKRIKNQPARREVWRNLIVFRLATGCGLRAAEIAGLDLAHVKTTNRRPVLDLPARICKRQRPREVSLNFDGATLADLAAWKAAREADGAGPDDPFVPRLRKPSTNPIITAKRRTTGNRPTPDEINRYFRQACKTLGKQRMSEVHAHTGRHTFATYAALNHPLHIVQRTLGHRRLDTTGQYLHVLDALEAPGRLFHRPPPPPPTVYPLPAPVAVDARLDTPEDKPRKPRKKPGKAARRPAGPRTTPKRQKRS